MPACTESPRHAGSHLRLLASLLQSRATRIVGASRPGKITSPTGNEGAVVRRSRTEQGLEPESLGSEAPAEEKDKWRKGEEEASRRKRGVRRGQAQRGSQGGRGTTASGHVCHPGHRSGEDRTSAQVRSFDSFGRY